MAVDVWGGMNQGLASLNNTFDDLARQRQVDEQQARQARLDALQEPILRAQGETANLNAEEARRKITDLRAYDAARKDLLANPGTVPTLSTLPNPEFKPEVPGQVNPVPQTQGLRGSGAIDPADIYTKPAEGLPTMDVAGTRPLTRNEQTKREVDLAIQHNQWDRVSNLVTVSNLMEKLDPSSAEKLTAWTTEITKVAQSGQFTPEQIKAFGDIYANKIDPSGELAKEVRQFNFKDGGMQKDIYGPDGTWMGKAVTDGKGTVHIVQPKEPKSATETDLYLRAAKGDPEAAKAVAAIQAGKIRVAKEGRADPGMGAAGALNIPPGVPGERNDAALQGMSQANMQIVKQLVDYKIPLPSGFALKAPFWQEILGRAALYDPSFDATQYQVRMSVKRDFNSGKSATNIRSLNTAISHLDTLDAKVKALDNSSYPFWNKIANAGIETAGDGRVRGVTTTATAVESELAAVFKGMGATDQEIKAWRENFKTVSSPKQFKESIDTAIELLGGRLQALNSQYETGMGRPKDFHFLSDKSRAILKRLGANVDAIDGVGTGKAAPVSAPVGPPTGAVPVPSKVTKAGKPVYKLPDGKLWAED